MALEQFNLDGQVAIVTGAGKGVGQGIARVLAEAGATVVGTARTESDIVGTIDGIEKSGGKGLALVADAMSRPDGERVVGTTIEQLRADRHPDQQRRWIDIRAIPRHHRRRLPAHLRLVCHLGVHHEPVGGSAHDRGRPRLDRQHLLGLSPVRHPGADCVLRRQGRTGGAHPGDGAGARAEDPRQRDRAGLFRDRRSAGKPRHDARVIGEDEGDDAAAPPW